MSLNDQFEYGRIPLRPLAYKNKDLAQCNEFIIDYGKDGTYHMYISDSNDPTILIDLTYKMIKEVLPNAKINANQFQILIEGIEDPTSLQDIINFIYKRFAYADNVNGFVYARDIDKVYDPTTKTVLLRNTDGTIMLPVTTTDSVIDKSGKSIQERLDSMTRLGFSMTYINATEDDQTEFEFEYPFENYSDFVEVRIGTVYVDKSRYYITNEKDSAGNYTKAKLIFINSGTIREAIENGRRIDILFIYNALAKSDGKYEYMYGGNIANSSISAGKLEKTSDSYTLNDPSSIATSAAVYNLFCETTETMSNLAEGVIWSIDSSAKYSTLITLTTPNDEYVTTTDFVLVNIATASDKKSSVVFQVVSQSTGKEKARYTLKYPNGSTLTRGISANKTIRLLLNNKTKVAYILSAGLGGLKASRYVCNCSDQETVFSYKNLNYNTEDVINVYRNGVRLFSDIDYSIDTTKEEITLYVRTEEGERIVFEALSN